LINAGCLPADAAAFALFVDALKDGTVGFTNNMNFGRS
jgi:hypothetical protein